jgi:hypothetical protein
MIATSGTSQNWKKKKKKNPATSECITLHLGTLFVVCYFV